MEMNEYTQEQAVEIIESTALVMLCQYRCHYLERRALLATLSDENSQQLRVHAKRMSYSGRQNRLQEIYSLASDIQHDLGYRPFDRKLLNLSSSTPSNNKSLILQYEDLFEEASALAFIQAKCQLIIEQDSSDENTIIWMLAELRHEQDRRRSALLESLEHLHAINRSKYIETTSKLINQLKKQYEQCLVPNAISIITRIRVSQTDDFYMVRAAALPYEICKFQVYGLDKTEKMRKLEAKIKIHSLLEYSDSEIQDMYLSSKLAVELGNKATAWKIGQFTINSVNSQVKIAGSIKDKDFKHIDRLRFIAWSHKMSVLLSHLPETISLLMVDTQIISSLIAGRHSLTDTITNSIVDNLLHLNQRVKIPDDFSFLPNFIKDSFHNNENFTIFSSYQLQELLWLKDLALSIDPDEIKMIANKSAIIDLWADLNRHRKASKSWQNNTGIQISWKGLLNCIKIRSTIEYRKYPDIPIHVSLLKELFLIQNIIFEKWVIEEQKQSDIVNLIKRFMKSNTSISIAVLLTTPEKNDYVDDAIARALIKQLGRSEWAKLTEKEKHELLQKNRLAVLKAKKHGAESDQVAGLLASLSKDKAFQLAQRSSQRRKINALLKTRIEQKSSVDPHIKQLEDNINAKYDEISAKTIKKPLSEFKQEDTNLLIPVSKQRFAEYFEKRKPFLDKTELKILDKYCSGQHEVLDHVKDPLNQEKLHIKSFSDDEYSEKIDNKLSQFFTTIGHPNTLKNLIAIRIDLANVYQNKPTSSDSLIPRLNSMKSLVDDFREIRQEFIKSRQDWLQLAVKSNNIDDPTQELTALIKESEKLHEETSVAQILKLDAEKERLRILSLESDEAKPDVEEEIADAIQAKADAQKDLLLAKTLMQKYGEHEWNKFSEKERQEKILKVRVELEKMRKSQTEADLSEDARFIFNQLKNSDDLKKHVEAGQKIRLEQLIKEKQDLINSKKLSEKEADVWLEDQKANLTSSKPQDVLKLLQYDADKEKSKVLSELERAIDFKEKERIRQLTLGKQKLARINAARDVTNQAVFDLLSQQSSQMRTKHDEQERQRQLAKARLDQYRKNRTDMKITEESSDTTSLQSEQNIPLEIAKLIQIWQEEETLALMIFLDEQKNLDITDIFSKGYSIDDLEALEIKNTETFNQTKADTTAVESRQWKTARDKCFSRAAALKLIIKGVKQTANISNEKDKTSVFQREVENTRTVLVSHLETAHRRLREKVMSTLDAVQEDKLVIYHHKLNIQRHYQANLAIVLLGKKTDIKVDKSTVQDSSVFNELHKKHDLMKEKLVDDVLKEMFKTKVESIPDYQQLVKQVVDFIEKNPDTDITKAVRTVIKTRPDWYEFRQNLHKPKTKTDDIKKKMLEVNLDLDNEKKALFDQLKSANDSRDKQRQAQLIQAKLKRERKQLEREENFNQASLLLKSNQLATSKLEEQRKINLELARKRLANKRGKMSDLKALENTLFDVKTVMSIRANENTKTADLDAGEWIEDCHEKERDLLMVFKDLSVE